MNDREMIQIKEQFQRSIHTNFSEFVRYRLFKKPVFAGVRDTGMEDLFKELVPLREELLDLITEYKEECSDSELFFEDEKEAYSVQNQQLAYKIQESLARLNQVLDQTVSRWLQS